MSTSEDTRPRAPTPQPASTVENQTITRRPYTGSCHCGKIKLIVFLTLPFEAPYIKPTLSQPLVQLVRKCNCTVCHKPGFFHINLKDARDDFILLSPLDPLKELTNYKCGEKRLDLLFCPTCGVRALVSLLPPGDSFGEIVTKDLSDIGLSQSQLKQLGFQDEADAKAVKVCVTGDAWQEGRTHMLRVNAQTLDANQEGLDVREWHEKKWVQYVNWLDEVRGASSYDRPFHSGTY
jgi:hypothetical protein